MRVRNRILSDADADPDQDPGYQNDADPDPQHRFHGGNSIRAIKMSVWFSLSPYFVLIRETKYVSVSVQYEFLHSVYLK
jgi:hypothetical protein